MPIPAPWNVKKQLASTPEVARLAAEMASAFHLAQSYSGTTQRDWSHRKAEWICPSCRTPNFVNKMDCRACGLQWSADATLVAAGSPPSKRTKLSMLPPSRTCATGGQLPSLPPANRPAASHAVRDAVKLADAALQAAKDAKVPQAVLMGLQANLEAKQQEAASKQPVAKRLQVATHQESHCKAALAKAEERLAAAQQTAEEARAAHKKAQEEVRKVTAEVSQADKAPVQEPAEKNLLARMVAAVNMVDASMGTDRETAAKSELMEAQKAAQSAIQAATEPAAAPAAMPSGHKNPREDLLPTQEGDMEADDSALEELLASVPPSKRQRAAARLTQLGVQEEEPPQPEQQQK